MPFPIYATEAEVPESQRDVYELREEQWHPKVPDVTTLEGTLQKERDDRKKAEKEAREARDDAATLRRMKAANAQGVSDDALQRIREEEATARKPILDENAQLKVELTKLKLTDRVQADAIKYGVMTDRIEDAMLVLGRRAALSEEGTVQYLDEAGQVTAKTAEQFHVDLKKQKPWLYAGTGSSGSDSRASSSSGDAPPVVDSRTQTHRATVHGAF